MVVNFHNVHCSFYDFTIKPDLIGDESENRRQRRCKHDDPRPSNLQIVVDLVRVHGLVSPLSSTEVEWLVVRVAAKEVFLSVTLDDVEVFTPETIIHRF